MPPKALPKAPNTIKLGHKIATLPLRLLSALNIGPLGGENSISVIIETVLARKKGEEPDYELSKTERFFVSQLTKSKIPDEMIEYRELSFSAQEALLERYGDKDKLGVIWIGAGVFNLDYPLLKYQRDENWHIWTDASPRIVRSAMKTFASLQDKGNSANLSHAIRLPEDGKRLNEWIHFLDDHVDRIIIMGYGVTYALSIEENYEWLQQIKLPENTPLHMVFNSPGAKIPFLPGLMAAFHRQKMVFYSENSILQLFKLLFPGAEISWRKKREETRNKTWSTWIIDFPLKVKA